MLDRLFNSENLFTRAMERLFDTVMLNLLWLMCCLPIVTIGASTTAFYYAMMRLVGDGDHGSYPSRDFFRSFRANLKQGSLMGLLMGLVGGFFALDVYLSYQAGPGFYTFFLVFFAVLLLLWGFVAQYAFPLLARFDNTILRTILFAFTLSIRSLPKTVLLLALSLLGVWLCHLSPAFALFAPGILVEVQSVLLNRILKPWLPEEAAETGAEDEPEEQPE